MWMLRETFKHVHEHCWDGLQSSCSSEAWEYGHAQIRGAEPGEVTVNGDTSRAWPRWSSVTLVSWQHDSLARQLTVQRDTKKVISCVNILFSHHSLMTRRWREVYVDALKAKLCKREYQKQSLEPGLEELSVRDKTVMKVLPSGGQLSTS